jgi:hypothetical protein
MPFIILNDEQARVVTGSKEAVELRDRTGKVLAQVEPPVPEAEIAEAKRRLASGQRRWPSARVRDLLATLTEIRAGRYG